MDIKDRVAEGIENITEKPIYKDTVWNATYAQVLADIRVEYKIIHESRKEVQAEWKKLYEEKEKFQNEKREFEDNVQRRIQEISNR